ncbi:MAG: hypothetical protein J6B36_02815 [Muribaculaceae bacterium]|nr:hypothetical protein [Muribaculaceae bacterium]
MKKLWVYFLFLFLHLSAHARTMMAEDYYITAFNEMSDMLAGRDSLSIKRAVYFAEWAYYEGKLDYKTDFCDEIDRITSFVRLFYDVNKLSSYKTGKQMALNAYFFYPYSGNGYKPYTYDFETFSKDDKPWDHQFVSKVLKTHKGQCRSLPWMYKILAEEIGAEVSLAHAPRHCYIMYKDEDNLTPEEWINLEVTTNQMVPAWCIKQDFEICDSAVHAGTYMKPLTDVETVACQMAELTFGYYEKFHRYDKFTYYCASRSLEFYPMNPNAWIIRCKSLERITLNYLAKNGNIIDDYAAYLMRLMDETKYRFDKTYMTEETEKIREFWKQKAIEAQKYTQEKIQSK